jgi:NADH-quinone oxidoreductase subunit M
MPQAVTDNLLSLVIFLPLAGAIAPLFFPRPADETDGHAHGDAEPAKTSGAGLVRGWTLAVSLLTFLASLLLVRGYDPKGAEFQFAANASWIAEFGVRYHVGIDGISLLLVMLTTFISVLSVLYSFNVKVRIREYMVFLLLLETAMLGVFCALDLVLFYVFWEAVLIPMFFLIGIWGHERRIYAAVKFFLYTFLGSVLMLVGVVYVYVHTGTFDLVTLLDRGSQAHAALLAMGPRTLMWLFAAFALAFMIKVPMFPFHTWLPDAHVEAPTAGSVILAGVLLKMGTYGFIRVLVPLFPEQARMAAPIFITLAVIGIIYGALVAAVQPDMKKLVAYSSVSHLGFVMLGIFSFTQLGLMGALLQNINHGVSTGMLFFLVGMLYDRRHTREISAFGGIKRALPVLSAFFLIAMLSSIALPLTNGFVGEFAVLQGSYLSEVSGPKWTALAANGMILSAVYMLWLFQRVFTGPVRHDENRSLADLGLRERWVLAPFVVMIFWFGCYVSPFTDLMSRSVDNWYARTKTQASMARGASTAPVTRPATVAAASSGVEEKR